VCVCVSKPKTVGGKRGQHGGIDLDIQEFIVKPNVPETLNKWSK